jgi:hypothetical protein
MAAKKTHDAVYVERYNDRDGNEKKRYRNVGALFTREDGSMSLKLEAIPVNFSGWISMYVPRDSEERQPSRQAPAQRSSGGSVGGDLDDDIPFASPITRRNWSALS